jgi:alpha-tubulin suppressor-like RCC1 family protein
MNDHARVTTILLRHERSCKAFLKARVGILSTGDDHTLLLQNGRTYSCGAGDNGELGYECEPPDMIPGVMYCDGFICSSRLSAIPAFTNRRVKMVAAGQSASVVLLDDGTVYTFGIPFVCGHPYDQNEHVILTPRKVAALDGVIITCVAASRHAIAVSASGSVYSWGEGDHGGLGIGIFLPTNGPGSIQHEPRRVLSLRGIRICVACVGNSFTLLLSDDGVVFACGSNLHGELGFPQPSEISEPRPIEGVPRIQAMAGGEHTLLLSCEGDIFSCGWNEYGQLGLGHTNDVCVPTKVSSLTKFAAIAADTRHSAAISAEGHVYTWGAYGDG